MNSVVVENWNEESDILTEGAPLSSSPRISPQGTNAKPNSKGNTETPCALAYLEGSNESFRATKKVLPAIRANYEGRDSQVKGTLRRDFIPLDILNSLTQAPSPPPSREQLGPPTKFKKSSAVEVSPQQVAELRALCQFTL